MSSFFTTSPCIFVSPVRPKISARPALFTSREMVFAAMVRSQRRPVKSPGAFGTCLSCSTICLCIVTTLLFCISLIPLELFSNCRIYFGYFTILNTKVNDYPCLISVLVGWIDCSCYRSIWIGKYSVLLLCGFHLDLNLFCFPCLKFYC